MSPFSSRTRAVPPPPPFPVSVALRPLHSRLRVASLLPPRRRTARRHRPRCPTADTTPEIPPFHPAVRPLLRPLVLTVYAVWVLFLLFLRSPTPPTPATSCATRRSPAPARSATTGSRSASAGQAAGTLTIADNGIGMDRAGADRQPRHHRPLGHRAFLDRLAEAKDGARPDRPVRRRLLLGVHGRRPHRGDEPRPRRLGGLRLALVGRQGFEIAQASAGARARAARHRDRAASEGGRQALSWSLRDRAHRAHLLRPHPVPDRARRQGRRAAPDQRRARSGSGRKSELKAEDYKQAYRTLAGASTSRR